MKKDLYTAFLRKYLIEHKEALLWMLGYAAYVHAIDDIIDNEIPEDQTKEEFVLKTFEFAEVIYSNIFYLQNINTLRPLVKMASDTYMTSVQFEKSSDKWKQHVADSLRQSGNEILIAVIGIVSGVDKRREASMELREISYWTHHTPEGLPI